MQRLPFQYQRRPFWVFFCPICKSERRSFYWPSPRPRHYAMVAVAGAVLAGGVWPWTGFKGLFLALPLWAAFEFIYRAKARQSLVCPSCGFDPYLYKHDVKLARKKVEQFFEKKKQPSQ
jgi:hypothetical protein